MSFILKVYDYCNAPVVRGRDLQ